MNVVVTGTLGLVEDLLGTALAVISLETASKTVGGVGDGLLDLVLGGLGGVRSELLLGLCQKKYTVSLCQNDKDSCMSHTSREILATCVRHDGRWW